MTRHERMAEWGGDLFVGAFYCGLGAILSLLVWLMGLRQALNLGVALWVCTALFFLAGVALAAVDVALDERDRRRDGGSS